MRFVSRYLRHRVQILTEHGAFGHDGRMRLVRPPGYVDFREGQFHTSNIEIIKLLLFHPWYGRDFFSRVPKDAVVDGSWEKIVNTLLEEENKGKKVVEHTPINDGSLNKYLSNPKPVPIQDGFRTTTSDREEKKVIDVKEILRNSGAEPVQ